MNTVFSAEEGMLFHHVSHPEVKTFALVIADFDTCAESTEQGQKTAADIAKRLNDAAVLIATAKMIVDSADAFLRTAPKDATHAPIPLERCAALMNAILAAEA